MTIGLVKMQLKTSLLMLSILALSACTASMTQITSPNGQKGFLIECDGSTSSWATCYEGATQACKGTYKIIDRNESSTPTSYGPIVRRNMIIECHK